MNYLDATIAMAVTLGALATAVTITIEIFMRFVGLRKRDQLNLFLKIYNKSFAPRFSSGSDQVQFLEKILVNPLWPKKIKQRDKFNAPEVKISMRDCLFNRGSNVYEDVSLEHVLRRITELPGVLDYSRDTLIQKLQEFNNEYNELCAAASAKFKRNRHLWSWVVGVLVAVVMNVNGLRIFEAFMQNPALAATVIAQMDDLKTASEEAEVQLQKQLEVLEKRSAGGSVTEEQAKKDAEAFQQRIDDLNSRFSSLESQGIPIGWQYPPHQQLVPVIKGWFVRNDPDSATAEAPALSAWLGSVLAMFGTGLLIGMGAPFWFDVAMRLADVRKMFSGGGSTSDEYRGASPPTTSSAEGAKGEDPALPLITRVVSEAIASSSASGSRRLLVEKREIS